jgi:hypothetical protein
LKYFPKEIRDFIIFGLLIYCLLNISNTNNMKVQSVEHFGKRIVYEMAIDDGYIQNYERSVNNGEVRFNNSDAIRFGKFPILTYEDDGPVGSYLSVRYVNNIVLIGNFIFFVKFNSGFETYTNFLGQRENGWGGIMESKNSNDAFLKHEVYLIPESPKTFSYTNLQSVPRLFWGRTENIPRGIQLFPDSESYSAAFTTLQQEKTYGEPQYKRLNETTLEAIPDSIDQIFGAARIYIDGFGWRFLIPNDEGALKALDVLKSTTDKEDREWIESNDMSTLTEYQRELLTKHFAAY